MNIAFTQGTRDGKLTTAFAADVLVLQRFDGTEQINGLFDYHVEALSAEANLDFDDIIGTHATVEVVTEAGGSRFFDGIVTEARWIGLTESGNRYALTMRPWIWVAGLRRNQRIYHNLSVTDILQELLTPYLSLGSPALEKKLSRSYPVLEYTVQ